MDQKHQPLSQQELNTWGDKLPFYCIAVLWIATSFAWILAGLQALESTYPTLFDPKTDAGVLFFVIPAIAISITFLAVFLAALKYLFKHHYNKH